MKSRLKQETSTRFLCPSRTRFHLPGRYLLTLLVPIIVFATSLTPHIANAAPASQQALKLEEPDSNNLRLLTIRVGPRALEGLLDAYEFEGITLIPVGALSQAIDLPLIVEPEKGVIRGTMYNKDDTLFLDLGRRELVLSGRTQKVSPEQIKIYPGDIYVDANLLSSWLPFTLDVDLYSSVLTIRSPTKLPFEERLERETRYAGLKARGVISRPEYPGYFEPYKNWTYPFITATVQTNSSYDTATSTSGTNYNYSVHGTGDLFKLESSLYISGNNQENIKDLRITLGRTDPRGGLLGPLRAQEYRFGHINSPTSSLISRPTGNPLGVMASNFPLSRQGEFDRHTFRGELPEGWEVELYQNDALAGYVNKPVNGQYVFENLPLYFGRNYFRLVFYGPQGQKREETHTFELNDALAKKGQHLYRSVITEDPDGEQHSGIQYDFGLADRLTLSTELQSLTLGPTQLLGNPAEKHSYSRIGLRGLLGGVFYSVDGINDANGGTLANLGIKSSIGANTRIDLNSTQLDNYVSDTFPLLADPLTSRNELLVNAVIPPVLSTRIPFSVGIKNEQFQSGAFRNTVTNRISIGIHRFSMSNNLSLINATSQAEQMTGQLQMSLRRQKFNLRGDIGYSLTPVSDVTSAAITIDNIRRGRGIYSFGLNQFITNSVTQVSARYTRPVGKFSFNADATHSTAGTTTIGFGLTVGIGREPRTGNWIFDSTPIAGTGAISARVFLDRNQNGLYDEGETPIPGVKFTRNGGGLQGQTDEQGIAFISNLTSYTPVDIGLSLRSLEDPLWSPSIEGIRVTPRPGSVAIIDLPILETGEIDGTVYLARGGGLGTVSDVLLELINGDGKIIKTTVSAPDGFYVFSGVPTGKFLVRVSPQQINKLGLFDVRPVQIDITPDKQFISGINFRLERK